MDSEIVIVLAASVFVFSLLIFLFNFVLKYQKRVISFTKEKELMQSKFEQILLQSQVEVQESTFSTLSKELHDNIGQLLSTAKMLLGITERITPNPPDTLMTATETVGKAIYELRSLSKSLSKEWLEQFDLIKNLEAEVERVNSVKAIKINLTHPGKLVIKSEAQTVLFRIIQEAMQNSIKHSGAEIIDIKLHVENNILTITINDNGKGFEPQQRTEGVGIINMKQRTKSLNGAIKWESSNKGTTLSVTVPVKVEENENFSRYNR
jgi:signal transduction histidine kinase